MTIDEKIAVKEQEMRDNRVLLNKYSLLHPKEQGKSVHYNTPKESLLIDLYSQTDELLSLEHELLLNEKNPQVMRLDVNATNTRINQLKVENTDTQATLDRET